MHVFPHFTPHFTKNQWTLPQVLEYQAAAIGEKPFLQWAKEAPLSFAETNRRANQLAYGLKKFGITKGARVVFFMPNSLEFVLAWFAINKLGAVEAPINIAYKGSFLEHQVNICDGMRCDRDGWYYFVDRMKDALRRRGENISSFEIEEPIRKNPAVADVAVVAAPTGTVGGEDEIKACVVLKPGATLSPEDLIRWCDDRMPSFAVPRYVDFLDTLPKTPTEKVQKNKLRDMGISANTWDRVKAGVKLKDEIERDRKKKAR